MSSINPRGDYEEAVKLKTKGNEAFKKKEYQNALKYYSSIILHLGMNSRMNISQITNKTGRANPYQKSSATKIQKKIDELRLICFNNMAAVYLKQEKYENVIEKAGRVLDDDVNNKKALFRRGMAYRKLGKLNQARDDLLNAARTQNLEQVDPAIQRELLLLKKDMENIKPTRIN